MVRKAMQKRHFYYIGQFDIARRLSLPKKLDNKGKEQRYCKV